MAWNARPCVAGLVIVCGRRPAPGFTGSGPRRRGAAGLVVVAGLADTGGWEPVVARWPAVPDAVQPQSPSTVTNAAVPARALLARLVVAGALLARLVVAGRRPAARALADVIDHPSPECP